MVSFRPSTSALTGTLSVALLVVLAIMPSFVAAHGRMTNPPTRYRKDATDPVEGNYPINGQVSRTMMSGTDPFICGGVTKEGSSVPVTEVNAGSIGLEYTVTAGHKGEAYFSISRDEESFANITEPFQAELGTHTIQGNIPDSYKGPAVIRWYWAADLTAPEIYVSCSDVLVK
ncbi:hypothetical protein CXG81DRAFT_20854 [Caulochytrium protostelioides]|uniref:Chitin-binding type-4 domain-containing protein n=1 Tax=Caulochytrium protostelioides TaxID=1555241 RepID=A0A4P9WZJ5_9FUNG|nr:hypothetical protein CAUPRSCDRAFT_11739 [Caulochytrium protostelioides]RKO98999.1 hypothetical protein CXG81DRAFT_20854 [Caulochytrium protostelioides]|eukprot:RKO98999.1 hypothetical protein CXG81DRAFT_20854 [Caulochytrium protostelioides]